MPLFGETIKPLGVVIFRWLSATRGGLRVDGPPELQHDAVERVGRSRAAAGHHRDLWHAVLFGVTTLPGDWHTDGVGAKAGGLLRTVVAQGMKLAALSILVGLPGAFALSRLLIALLFGVQPNDPLTFASIAMVLALTGCWRSGSRQGVPLAWTHWMPYATSSRACVAIKPTNLLLTRAARSMSAEGRACARPLHAIRSYESIFQTCERASHK